MTWRPGSAGQLAAHRVGDAVGEVLVLRAAQVLEREHRERLAPPAPLARAAVAPPPGEEHAEAEQEPEPESDGRARRAAARRSRDARSSARRRPRLVDRIAPVADGVRPRPARRRTRAAVAKRSAGASGERPLDAPAPPPPARSPGCARERARRLGEPPAIDRLRRRAGERRLARQHLVEHAAEAVDVGPGVERPARRPPAPGSCRPACPTASPVSVSCSSSPAERPGDAEVGHQRVPSRASRMFSGLMSRWTTPCWWA